MFTFETAWMPEETGEWRRGIRDFISREHQANPHADAWLGEFSEEFSQKLGAAGYIGMTWPTDYGGHGRSDLERYVVLEELLAAGAPVSAPFFAGHGRGQMLLGNRHERTQFGIGFGFGAVPTGSGRLGLAIVRAKNLDQRRSSVALHDDLGPHGRTGTRSAPRADQRDSRSP